ncbi:UNVERIFIED_CONTAM: hypothetical protein ABIC26_002652 [Paenibacillus sp. PvR008]
MIKEKYICKHCTGRPTEDREPLMSNGKGDYTVFINSCNYLEDSEVGNRSIKCSLFGVKIYFCPVCGRKL